MLKHNYSRAVLLFIVLINVVLLSMVARATDFSDWLTSPLTIKKQVETRSLPPSYNGNIDCNDEDETSCSVRTNYGAAIYSNSSVRLNGSKKFYQVVSNVDNQPHFFPIPNSDTFITYTSQPAFGVYLYFNYNFLDSISRSENFSQPQFKINKPPDGALADKSSAKLPADLDSVSFSEDGKWMVVSVPNTAVVRVNLQTFEVLPFAQGYDYSVGLDPSIKTAVTNDGRYAVVSSKSFNRFQIYDLSTCAPTPSSFSMPVSCQSRDLLAIMRQKIDGFRFNNYIRFLNESTIDTFATTSENGSTRTDRILLSHDAIGNQIDYLSVGDSYISGEGAFDYQGGTDTETNRCHISLISYTYLIGRDLDFNSFHSIACSGAIINDITNTGMGYIGPANHRKKIDREKIEENNQLDGILNSFSPGYIDQLDFVKKYQPKIITLSIGGNDMGFTEILKACTLPAISGSTCYNSYEDRLELINFINTQVYPKLIDTYNRLKAAGSPDMRIYVVGYPQIAKPYGSCALNVRLNNDEVIFSQLIIDYLDRVIKVASDKTGVFYIDTQNAFFGHRLCEADPGSVAVNGFTAGNDRPGRIGGPIGDESYHPNDFGYQLLENKILIATHNLTAPMPLPDKSSTLPDLDGLEILNIAKFGRAINDAQYDPALSDDVIQEDAPATVTVSGSTHALVQGSTLRAELHSNITSLGSFTVNSPGDVTGTITIPDDVPDGYHTIHFYGENLNGEQVDIYKYVYVTNPRVQTATNVSVNGEVTNSQNSAVELTSASKADIAIKNFDSRNSPIPPNDTALQSTPSASPKVLGEVTGEQKANHFNPGWLLLALPAGFSLIYLIKTKPL